MKTRIIDHTRPKGPQFDAFYIKIKENRLYAAPRAEIF